MTTKINATRSPIALTKISADLPGGTPRNPKTLGLADAANLLITSHGKGGGAALARSLLTAIAHGEKIVIDGIYYRPTRSATLAALRAGHA